MRNKNKREIKEKLKKKIEREKVETILRDRERRGRVRYVCLDIEKLSTETSHHLIATSDHFPSLLLRKSSIIDQNGPLCRFLLSISQKSQISFYRRKARSSSPSRGHCKVPFQHLAFLTHDFSNRSLLLILMMPIRIVRCMFYSTGHKILS